MPRFDGYTATTAGVRPEDLVGLLFGISDSVRTGRGFHRFEHRHAVVDQSGDEFGSVSHGGEAHAGRVMFEVKGERSPSVVERFRKLVPEHRCTRVDSCEDFDEPGAWDRLLGHVLEVKAEHGLKGERRGDWDFPEDGRTQYLGAPSSPVRARLYEKGKQPGYRHLERRDWVRLEVQVRPVKDAKTAYSAAGPAEVWGASPYSRDLAGRVLAASVGRLPAGAVWKESKRDAAIAWMCEQYGAHILSLKNDVGDWQALGLTLGEIIVEQANRRGRGG